MRDEDVRQSELVLQFLQQVDDLGLHGHVQRRHRLVADDDLRTQREAAGDPDPLPLAAGELVRIAVDVLGVQADDLEQLLDPPAAVTLRCDLGVDVVRLADDVADGHPWVQRRVRVLEDDLDVAAQCAQGLPLGLEDVLALEQGLAAGGHLQQHEQLGERRLATARLAHDAQRLALVQLEGHAVDGLHVTHVSPEDDAGGQRKVLHEVLDVEHDLADLLVRGCHRGPPGRSGMRLTGPGPPRAAVAASPGRSAGRTGSGG